MVERLTKQNQNLVVPIQMYTVLKPGSTRVTFGLRNLSARTIMVMSKSLIAKFTAADAIPNMLTPHIDKEENGKESSKQLPLLSQEKQNQLFDKIDLSGTAEWYPEQKE